MTSLEAVKASIERRIDLCKTKVAALDKKDTDGNYPDNYWYHSGEVAALNFALERIHENE
jgi:hypothetical protein